MATLDKDHLKKKRSSRFYMIIIFSFIEVIITPYPAYLIHQFFLMTKQLGQETLFFDFNYFNAVKILCMDHQVQLWYFIIQVVYILYLIWLTFLPKAEISNTREIQVTDKIVIPVSVGNGQYGTARFTNKEEQKKLFSEIQFDGTNQIKGKGGLVVSMKKQGEKDVVQYIKENVHSLIVGATGSGKTRRILLQTVWLQLLSGLSVVVSDVKGEIYYYTNGFAKLMGYSVITIDLRNPRKSIHYNFLQSVLEGVEEGDTAKAIDSTWDLVSVLVGEKKGEPLWYNGETAVLAAAILIVCIEAEKEYRNLTNVYYFIAYMCEPDKKSGVLPISIYLATLEDVHPARQVFAMAQVTYERTRSSFFSSALGTLKLFTNPNVAEMSSKSDFKLEDISSKKTIVYMIIPDERKTLYPLASIFIQQLYMAQVQLANKSGLRLPIETDYDLDEIGNFPTIPVLVNMASAGRSRGVRLNAVIQDYQQLQSKYKDDFETIKSCCRVKIYLKSDNTKTLEEIAKSLGKYTVEVTSASTSASTQSKSGEVNLSNSSNMAGRELLMPSEISMIDMPYALCMITGEFPSITKLPDLSQYQVNKIWGLGDEDHNIKLIMKRESEREERSLEELKIPLWGIWRLYTQLLEEQPEPEADTKQEAKQETKQSIKSFLK